MLVTQRRLGESLVLQTPAGPVVIRLLNIRGGNAILGIEADRSIPIDRAERLKEGKHPHGCTGEGAAPADR